MSNLFTPYKLGPVTLRNRTIRSAASSRWARTSAPPNSSSSTRLGGRAHRHDDAAYAAVSRSGLSFNKQLWLRPAIVPGLREITDAIHREGPRPPYRSATAAT